MGPCRHTGVRPTPLAERTGPVLVDSGRWVLIALGRPVSYGRTILCNLLGT